MAVTVKPYYNYKKEANYYLALIINALLKRSVSLKEVLNPQTKASDFEFVISSVGNDVNTIKVKYKGGMILGTIFFTSFEFPVFYAANRFTQYRYGLALTQSEVGTIKGYAHVLLRPTEDRTNLLPNSVAISNSYSVILNYTNQQGTSVDSILWTDRGKS